MAPCLAYRHLHEQTNAACAIMVLLAEFNLGTFTPEARGQELKLHGLLHTGAYREDRGMLLRNGLMRLADAGLKWRILSDSRRIAALQERLTALVPGYDFQLYNDLGVPGGPWSRLPDAFDQDARILLIEARHSIRGLPVHVLLARREGNSYEPGLYSVMNTQTGRNYLYEGWQLNAHLESPVHGGAVAFAGQQYLHTGIAVRIWK